MGYGDPRLDTFEPPQELSGLTFHETCLAVGVAVVAIPAAVVVGPVVRLAVAVAALPLLAVGALAGLGQVSRRAALSFLVAGIALLLLVAVAGPQDPSQAEPPGSPGGGSQASDPTAVTFAGGGVSCSPSSGSSSLSPLDARGAPPDRDRRGRERTIDPSRPERDAAASTAPAATAGEPTGATDATLRC
jgi:hypothetical protein